MKDCTVYADKPFRRKTRQACVMRRVCEDHPLHVESERRDGRAGPNALLFIVSLPISRISTGATVIATLNCST